ncbi:MAG TPA: DNA recombination protein RmuC [Caulobacteraceae bacterium]|nr:DNA recombination protein RmuC [Caulobacteraceae bacterium]
MNGLVLLTGLFALAAVGAATWAVIERARAARAEERARLLEANAQTLKVQAAQSAEAVADALVKRAGETFEAQERLVQAKLEAQLKPVAESLAKFQAQAAAAEKARAEETGGLKSQVAALMSATSAVQDETRKLAGALRRGAGVQGRWGEQTLRNVLEAAGLSRRFDFEEQFSLDTEEGRRRPDVKVRLPGGAAFVIDAKCSLNAFLEAQDAPDDAARDIALMRHAQSVRAHIAGLSAKAYWDQFKAQGSPDFVAMFVPGDGFLAAALDQAPDLMAEAMDRRVLVVTPTTLFALCKAVAYGWRVEEQAKNADAVAALGRELYKRIAVMGGHALRLGRSLDDSVKRYNEFAGSLESQVLTQARRFEDLSVDHEGREIPELAALDTAVRALTKSAATARSDESSVLTLESAAPTSAA